MVELILELEKKRNREAENKASKENSYSLCEAVSISGLSSSSPYMDVVLRRLRVLGITVVALFLLIILLHFRLIFTPFSIRTNLAHHLHLKTALAILLWMVYFTFGLKV